MKTILITGATAGIGRHAALALVAQGHHVIATGRRVDALEALKKDAKGDGKLDVLRLDVTSEAETRAVAEEALALTGGRGIDVLVNNAGYGQMGPASEVTDEELRKQYDTNVFGLMNVTRAFLPQLRARGEARIVNVGSIGGRVTFPLMGVYNSTKYAVESLSDVLRNELMPFGIRVSLVEPGPIRTEFNDRAFDSLDLEKMASSPYAPITEQAARFKADFDKFGVSPEVTTKAIAHAALAKRPRIRYVVPFSSSVMLALLGFVPTHVVDFAMRTLAGLTRKNLLPATPFAIPDGGKA